MLKSYNALIAPVKRVLVQTRKKALNAGMMRKLLLCMPVYSTWACDRFDSVGKTKLVSGVQVAAWIESELEECTNPGRFMKWNLFFWQEQELRWIFVQHQLSSCMRDSATINWPALNLSRRHVYFCLKIWEFLNLKFVWKVNKKSGF